MKIKKLPAALQLILLYLLIVAVGFVCLILVYMLPTERIQNNVNLSADTIYKDGDQASIVSNGDASYRLDPFTDCLMLEIAAYDSERAPIYASLLNEYLQFEDPLSTLFYKAWSDDTEFEVSQYPRYWHGYLVFLKPLLLLFSYHDIREVMMTVQFSLAAAIVGLLSYKKQGRFVPPFIAAWLFMNPLSLSMSMQYNTIFTLTLLSLLACIFLRDSTISDNKSMALLFFAVGCLTSYFDFLTYPLVAIGLPAAYILQRVYPPPPLHY